MTLRPILGLLLVIVAPVSASALTYSDWRAASFTEEQLYDEAISDATADPDGDGMTNLHEYVFAGQPLNAEANLSPVLETMAGTLALTYRERHDLAGVQVRLQGSDTLNHWITYNSVTEADRVAYAGYDEVTLLDPQPFTSNRRFLRLRLELLPVAALRAPVQLALSVVTPTTFELSWTDPNTTETGYAVERRNRSTGDWERLITLGADTGAWTHTAADYQTGTTYRVVATGPDSSETASGPVTPPDTDGDGLPDALELGDNYAGLAGTYASSPNQFSSNGSGVSDGWQAANGYNPVAAFNHEADFDQDGLSDSEEYVLGTDPRNDDTDGDGILDPQDGWAKVAAFAPSRLALPSYVVIPIGSVGSSGHEINNAGVGLAAGNGGFFLWQGAPTALPGGKKYYGLSESGRLLYTTNDYTIAGYYSLQEGCVGINYPQDFKDAPPTEWEGAEIERNISLSTIGPDGELYGSLSQTIYYFRGLLNLAYH